MKAKLRLFLDVSQTHNDSAEQGCCVIETVLRSIRYQCRKKWIRKRVRGEAERLKAWR